MFNGTPRFVWVLALAGCFVDKGGDPLTDPSASDSASSTTAATSGDETAAGATGGSGATTTEASTAMSTSGDMSTTGTTGGADATGTTGGECQPLALLAMTDGCVKGVDIASEAWGTQRCEEEFGAGWSWLEHHEQGGWDVQGTWIEEASVGLRGWVQITNQDSECFSTAGSLGLTWVRKPCIASCHPGCDAYKGDTACDQCLRLICVVAGG